MKQHPSWVVAAVLIGMLLSGCWVSVYDSGGDFGAATTRTFLGGTHAFRRLVKAVESPDRGLDQRVLGVTTEELRAAAIAFTDDAAPEARRRFVARAIDPANLPFMVQALFSPGEDRGYDNGLRVTIRNWGKRFVLYPLSSNWIMVPWTIERGREHYPSWNLEISHALAEMTVRRNRQNQDFVDWNLAIDLVSRLDPRGEKLERDSAIEWLGASLDPISNRFRIERSRIEAVKRKDDILPMPLPAGPCNPTKAVCVWKAELSNSELGRMLLRVTLTIREVRVVPDPLLTSFEDLLTRVRSLRWLSTFLDTHPMAQAIIEFSDERPYNGWFGLELRDGPQRYEQWTVHPDGRSVLNTVGDIVELGAVFGDALTADGTLEPGPGHSPSR